MPDSAKIFSPSSPPRFPHAREIPFAAFNNQYAGECCYVIGRGPTEFNYEDLPQVSEPIFFINDAVCLDKYARSETFFFAHDPQMLPWLDGAIKSTAIIPIDGKMFREATAVNLKHRGGISFYHWPDTNKEKLLHMNREQIARAGQLYTHTGTIHSLLHFAWFCGFTKINFIGCDGIASNDLPANIQSADGYDRRLMNLSKSSSADYTAISKAQRLLTKLLGLEATYLGIPGAKSRGFADS